MIESVGSDIDEAELTTGQRTLLDEDDGGFEIVPMNANKIDIEVGVHTAGGKNVGSTNDNAEREPKTNATPQPPPTQKQQQTTNLKDLLDLDLELDNEIPFLTTETTLTLDPPSHPPSSVVPTSPSHPRTRSIPQLYPKQVLFFPLPALSMLSTKARPRDIFDVARENKWNWRDPDVGFFRTGTEEDIRKGWEERKVELTKEWKRRCREAGKVSRRRRRGWGEGDFGMDE